MVDMKAIKCTDSWLRINVELYPCLYPFTNWLKDKKTRLEQLKMNIAIKFPLDAKNIIVLYSPTCTKSPAHISTSSYACYSIKILVMNPSAFKSMKSVISLNC